MYAVIDGDGCVIGLCERKQPMQLFIAKIGEVDPTTPYNIYEVHSLEELKRVMDEEGHFA